MAEFKLQISWCFGVIWSVAPGTEGSVILKIVRPQIIVESFGIPEPMPARPARWIDDFGISNIIWKTELNLVLPYVRLRRHRRSMGCVLTWKDRFLLSLAYKEGYWPGRQVSAWAKVEGYQSDCVSQTTPPNNYGTVLGGRMSEQY